MLGISTPRSAPVEEDTAARAPCHSALLRRLGTARLLLWAVPLLMYLGRAAAARCRTLGAPSPSADGAPPPGCCSPLSLWLCIWGLYVYHRSTSYHRGARGKSARRPMPRPRPRATRHRPPFRAAPPLASPPPILHAAPSASLLPHLSASLRFGGGIPGGGWLAMGRRAALRAVAVALRAPPGARFFPLAPWTTSLYLPSGLPLALRARSFYFGGGHRSHSSPAPPPFICSWGHTCSVFLGGMRYGIVFILRFTPFLSVYVPLNHALSVIKPNITALLSQFTCT